MNIRQMSFDNLSPGKIQALLAVVMGELGASNAENRIFEFETKLIEDYVNTHYKGKDIILGTIEYFIDAAPFEIRGTKVGLLELKEKDNKVLTMITKEMLYRKINNLLRTTDQVEMVGLILNTKYCRNMIYEDIIRTCNSKQGAEFVDSSRLETIYNNFAKRAANYSILIFNDNNSRIMGWIRNTFRQFYSRFKGPDDIYSVLNQRNQDFVVDSEGDTTLLDLIATDQFEYTNVINFKAITEKIAKASAVLYKHNGKMQLTADIYTHFLSNRVNHIIANTKGYLRTDMIQLFTMKNRYEKDSTIGAKKADRDRIADAMETIVTHGLDYSELEKLLNTVYTIDAGNKPADGHRIFNHHKDYKSLSGNVRSSVKAYEVFNILCEGYLALRQFINFLASKKIDLFSFDPTIFRNIQYPRRFESFEDYLQMKDVVFHLIKESATEECDEVIVNKNSKPTLNNETWTNDAVYNFLCTGYLNGSNLIDNLLKSEITLKDVVTSIQRSKEIKNDKSLFNHCKNCYNRYKANFSPIAIYTDQNGWPAFMLNTLDEPINTNKLNANPNLFDLVHYGRQNYAMTFDPGLITMNGEEAIEFCKNYNSILNESEARLILELGIKDKPLAQILSLLVKMPYAMYSWVSNPDFYKQTLDSGLNLKIAVAYVNCFMALMDLNYGGDLIRDAFREETKDDGTIVKVPDLEYRDKSVKELLDFIATSKCYKFLFGDRGLTEEQMIAETEQVRERMLFGLKTSLGILRNQEATNNDLTMKDLYECCTRAAITEAYLLKFDEILCAALELKLDRIKAFESSGATIDNLNLGIMIKMSAYNNLLDLDLVKEVADIKMLQFIDLKIVNWFDKEEFKSMLIDCNNNVLSKHEDLVSLFHLIKERTEKKFSSIIKKNDSNVIDKKCASSLTDLYRELAAELRAYSAKSVMSPEHHAIRQRLITLASLDSDGYVVNFNSRLVYSGDLKYFVHSSGFLVEIITENEFNQGKRPASSLITLPQYNSFIKQRLSKLQHN